MLARFTLLVTAALALLPLSEALADSQNSEKPSLEFLEFLGEFETEDGLWVDPLTLLDNNVAETETEIKIEAESSNEGQDDE